MKWLNPNVLCSFGEDQVRIELGPQIIELDCTDENLSDEVTAPHYKIGGIDAHGRVIRPDEAEVLVQKNPVGAIGKGQKMHCVDWRAKHVPHVWKVYQWQETDQTEIVSVEVEGGGNGKLVFEDKVVPVSRFIKVGEFAERTEAIAFAEELLEGMV